MSQEAPIWQKSPEEQAEINLERLRNDFYPGRGIVVGLNKPGTHLVQVYWVMGRSEGSRNRVLVEDNGSVWTRVHDEDKEKGDPKTTIYPAILEKDGHHIVSNGLHTIDLASSVEQEELFEDSMRKQTFEPDPLHTPRIAAVAATESRKLKFKMAIVRPHHGAFLEPEHQFYQPSIKEGLGRALQTYKGNGSTEAFEEYPYLLPLGSSAPEIADFYWDVLSEENRVALAVKTVDLQTEDAQIEIRNRHQSST